MRFEPLLGWLYTARRSLGQHLTSNRLLIGFEIIVAALLPELLTFAGLPRTILPLLALAVLSFWLRKVDWGRAGLFRPARWLRYTAIGASTGIIFALVGDLVIVPYLRVLLRSSPDIHLSYLRGDARAFAVTLVSVWILAAVIEEIVYRGYLLNRIADLFHQTRSAWIAGSILSALLFSAAHGIASPVFVLSSFCSGLIEAALMLRNDHTLWAAIAFHGMADTVGITLVFLGLMS